jgi:hypothetical protein
MNVVLIAWCARQQLTRLSSLFQLLRLTEDTLEQLLHDEAEPYGQSVGRIYLAKVPAAGGPPCARELSAYISHEEFTEFYIIGCILMARLGV